MARPAQSLLPGALAAAAALVLAGCGGNQASPSATLAPARTPPATATASPSPPPSPSPTPTPAPTPSPLVSRLPDWSADLHSPPVAVPLRFQAPTVGVDIPVEAVGLTATNAMDAPEGRPDDPVWKTGFWYRGGVEPGRPGVATIAGHLDDTLGRPGAFWNLRRLVAGDVIQIVDGRTGEVIRFRISEVHVYSNAEAATSAVLDRLFGPEAEAGLPPQVPADGISRLSLVTCAGVFTRGEYDHRYMVFAERLDGPGSPASPLPPTPPPTPGQPEFHAPRDS